MVLGIKFQAYTTVVSFLIPNPYHYMNQRPHKVVLIGSHVKTTTQIYNPITPSLEIIMSGNKSTTIAIDVNKTSLDNFLFYLP